MKYFNCAIKEVLYNFTNQLNQECVLNQNAFSTRVEYLLILLSLYS